MQFQIRPIRFLLSLLVSLLGFSWAKAEYRVFELRIGPRNSPNFRLVLSQLDPLQYPSYHPVPKDHVVEYIDTWMCYGRTNQKDFCERPNRTGNLTSATTRTPASAAQKP